MNDVFTAAVDQEAFKARVKELIGNAPLPDLKPVLELKWPSAIVPPALFQTVKVFYTLMEAIIAAVEVAKHEIIEANGGAPFDKEMALNTALDILDASIVFEGFVGSIVEKFDRPILGLLVSYAVTGKGSNWLGGAKALLGL